MFPLTLHASFIEATMGTAVVNDATASYHNPAALILLSNSQIITLGTAAYFHNRFSGQIIQTPTGFTQSGSSNTNTQYYLPSFYLGVPTTDRLTLGLAILSNFFNRNTDENSILRYSQSDNSIQNIDIVPAIGIKINEVFSLGAGLNFSYANFLLKPTSGFPNLNVPDSQSRNESDGTGIGGDIGLLLKPLRTTMVGFNYQSAVTYHLSGKSVFNGPPEVVSNHYHFTFWTPARSVLSLNHFVTSYLSLIGTIQYIQWSIFNTLKIHGIATQVGPLPMIVNANIPYHLHNSWIITLGNQYRINPKWIIRAAGSYVQSPGNSHYQLANGDNIVLGLSTAYEISKRFMVDASYAHAFIKDENIHIANSRNIVNGVNQGSRDSISLKLTFNII